MFETLLEGPSAEPVTVDEQAAWSRFDPPAEQTDDSPPVDNPEYGLVVSQIKTAREEIERLTRFFFYPQRWKQTMPGFPYFHQRFTHSPVLWKYRFPSHGHDVIELLRHPVQSIESVKYLDTGGDEQTFDATSYELDRDCVQLKVGKNWPFAAIRDNAVRIEYTAGFNPEGSPPVEIPERLKSALKFLAGWYYENRIPVTTTPTSDIIRTLDNLLKGFRSGYLPR